ncbi:hypothetical protein N7G274_003528 [Stereocaulon virgatum]|uniref:Uncharacterized protein n=1 Tax=Stereocaulon virgatum TaxID=373712 RepID=A0ABR4ADU9_9LECA
MLRRSYPPALRNYPLSKPSTKPVPPSDYSIWSVALVETQRRPLFIGLQKSWLLSIILAQSPKIKDRHRTVRTINIIRIVRVL